VGSEGERGKGKGIEKGAKGRRFAGPHSKTLDPPLRMISYNSIAVSMQLGLD